MFVQEVKDKLRHDRERRLKNKISGKTKFRKKVGKDKHYGAAEPLPDIPENDLQQKIDEKIKELRLV